MSWCKRVEMRKCHLSPGATKGSESFWLSSAVLLLPSNCLPTTNYPVGKYPRWATSFPALQMTFLNNQLYSLHVFSLQTPFQNVEFCLPWNNASENIVPRLCTKFRVIMLYKQVHLVGPLRMSRTKHHNLLLKRENKRDMIYKKHYMSQAIITLIIIKISRNIKKLACNIQNMYKYIKWKTCLSLWK